MAVVGLTEKLLVASELETLKYFPFCIVEKLKKSSDLSIETLFQTKLGRGWLLAEHDSSMGSGLRTWKFPVRAILFGRTGKRKK